MKFRDLPNGALFAYYPYLTCWVTALKVGVTKTENLLTTLKDLITPDLS